MASKTAKVKRPLTPEQKARKQARARKDAKRGRPAETPEQRVARVKQQWADPASFIRARQKAGKAAHRREPPPHAAELIRIACGEFGANITQIAALFQCHPLTLVGWRKRYPEIEQAIIDGHRIEEDALWGTLFRQATQEGNTVAAIVLLKFRGHRDSGPLPTAGQDGAVEQAARIRAALRAMQQADGEMGGNEDVPFGGNYIPH